ncbi:hypothetical protein DHEL01_v201800 [Diaporthe helianthi]|uniref:Uncharacterized protein n=1 Tax=Diaporthe helianthi TaxID=158607 RepID=A0A2P5IBA8_DIAHE|nr:hypothetical protein DHEL01_v201800 [Diaporthe helianthi]
MRVLYAELTVWLDKIYADGWQPGQFIDTPFEASTLVTHKPRGFPMGILAEFCRGKSQVGGNNPGIAIGTRPLNKKLGLALVDLNLCRYSINGAPAAPIADLKVTLAPKLLKSFAERNAEDAHHQRQPQHSSTATRAWNMTLIFCIA